jgi:hypothetical protein
LSEIIFHTSRTKTKTKTNLNEIDVELEWIQGLKEQVEFLNSEMKHHCILFKVQRLEFAIGMYGVRPSIKPLLFRFDLYLSFSKSNELHKNKRKRNYDYEPKIFSTAWRNKTKAQGLGGVR